MDLVDAWRGRRLVIVVPGGTRAWRLELHEGQLRGSDIGELHALGELERRLAEDTSDLEAARALGEALLPAPSAPEQRIDLLVIGPLARVPVAALFQGPARAIALRRIVRVPGVLPRRRPARSAARGAVAIGDPLGDLPASAREAEVVARSIGGVARIGRAATRAALLAAREAELLHVAAHTARRPDGVALLMSDGELPASQVAEVRPAPPLVVLASCAGAVGRDDAGNGSMAYAFLDAGADVVVATQRSIPDVEAALVIEAFYKAGGARDPAAVLPEIQLRPPRGVEASTWMAFEVIAARPVRR